MVKKHLVTSLLALVTGGLADGYNNTNITDATLDSNTTMQYAYIEHFKNAGIVPSLVDKYVPTAIMELYFSTVGYICPGTDLTIVQSRYAPSLFLDPVGNNTTLPTTFTLMMLDAGPPGTDLSSGCVVRHWLANGVTLERSGISSYWLNVSLTLGNIITEYYSPRPTSGSGPHRYVILLYAQPETFNPPVDLSQPNMGASKFCFKEYVVKTGLGEIIAGTYFTVEQGTATFTPSATSAVITSTLLDVQTQTQVVNDGTKVPSHADRPASGDIITMMVILFSALLNALPRL